MDKGFIFNTNRCVGCHACIVACSNQNDVDPGKNWRSVYQYNPHNYPAIPVFFHSIACNHCEDAPCMTNCPANAFYRDPATQAVLLEESKCIGCKYCTWACPYSAPDYNPFKKVVEKCTLCIDKLNSGDIPACAKCCPTGALNFGEPDSYKEFDRIKGFSDYSIGPKIRFVAKSEEERIPEITSKIIMDDPVSNEIQQVSKPSIRSLLGTEWSLAIFTFLVPLLVGMFAGSTLSNFQIPNLFILLVSLFTLIMSLFHLGRKERFYRAIFNFRTSWLSREILFFILFLGVLVFIIVTGIHLFWLVGIALILGLGTTYSIDMVYHLKTRMVGSSWHSSQTLFTAMLFTAIFLEAFLPFIFILTLKLLLYLYRKVGRAKFSMDWIASLFRVGLAIAAPLFFYILDSQTGLLITIIITCLGELIDRFEFYVELDFMTPEKEISKSVYKDLKRTG